MAKVRTKKASKLKYQCRHCTFSYDWHEIGKDGKPFLCRCPYYTDGKYSRFLSDTQCKEHFNLRQGVTLEQEANEQDAK